MAASDANIMIANDELSPSQLRNLEKELECKVIDRTLLILDIFAQRAQTREAMLQVEIAHWQYMLPRLIGMRASLGRQVGGVGTKNKGVGETKLELDRRKIEKRISQLNDELEQLTHQRQNQRKLRRKKGLPVVSLVGYTNAGKSTLMNALVEFSGAPEEKKVLEKDMPFATLETAVRRIQLPDNKAFLLTDTVGFIHKLPHHLIKAFRSTLEEIKEADLLIHVVDYSTPEHVHHIEITEKTLKEIGVENIPTLYAYNKADLSDTAIPKVQPSALYMSAKEAVGISDLLTLMSRHIFQDYVTCRMIVPYNRADLVSYFQENAHILDTSYQETGTHLFLECSKQDQNRYRLFLEE